MYLKKIEIAGFKSFTNKTTFDFHNGITAIVGPNGSGKSNVSDAVRWVLGEQSAKQLRGSNMQDVIFAGTLHKKPWAYASVSITFDNSDKALNIDFDEVVVTRKIYRSGESEYLLNSSNVRLKDITELFFDTGIGKDGYSIIGQGQVEKLLSSKADERRELFDEAVGITKLKKRKEDSIKKLQSEENALVRIKDILHELEKQLPNLEIQSNNANEYLSLRDNLKEVESLIFAKSSSSISNELHDLEEKENIVLEKLDELVKNKNEVQYSYEDLSNKLTQFNENYNKKNEELSNIKLTKNNLENKINLIKEQINNNKNSNDHINKRKDQILKDIDDNNLIISNSNLDLNKIIDDISKKENTLEDIKNINCELLSDITSLETEINRLNEDAINYVDIKGKIGADIKANEEIITQSNIRVSDISRQLIEEKTKKELLELELKEIISLYSLNEDKLSISNKKLDELNRNKNTNINELNILKNNLVKVNHNLDYDSAKLESLKNIVERYDGYGISIKKIMEIKNKDSNIFGVLADVINVEKKYELAIETILGSRLQNIVVNTQNDAKKLIEFLKKNKYGRATFLPLDANFKPSSIKNINILSEKGVIDTADNLLSCENKYKKIIKNLLGNVLVVDEINNAINIAKKTDNEYRMVTLDGELFFVGGAISGGAYKSNSNLLSRNREIDEIDKNIKEHTIKINDLKDNIKILEDNLILLEKDIANINNEINSFKLNKHNYSIEKNHLEKRIEDIDNVLYNLNKEYDNKQSNISNIRKIKDDLLLELNNLDENIISKEEIKNINNTLLLKKEEYKNSYEKEKDYQLNLSHLYAQKQFIYDNNDTLNNKNKKLYDEIKHLDNSLDINKENIIKLSDEINIVNNSIIDLDCTYKKLYNEINEYEHLRNEYTKNQSRLFKDLNDLNIEVTNIEKEKIRLLNRKEKTQEEYDNLISYMWEEYKINLLDIKDINISNLHMSELKKTSISIKNSIKALGSINIDAIEQYKDIKIRYETMKKQYDDIIIAKDKLIDIIKELDVGMVKLFTEGFDKISKEFDFVFKELFGGGSAKLILQDDDILNTDISIISQPPGKKLQNMMQLSGGEKALTAISLLFAIQKLKPSPFVLLDEIEAALDDTNVTRFAQYLRKLSTNTQFIVITHRRGTMLGSDRLYGITMKEKGVSSMVSVDLIENDLDK